jgi:hypothetical protein
LLRNLEVNNPLFKNLGNDSLLIDLRAIEAQVEDRLVNSYAKLLAFEVDRVQVLEVEAKAKLVDDIEIDVARDFDDIIISGSDNSLIHHSEIKVQLDIEERAREAEIAARDAVEADISVVAHDGSFIEDEV